MESESSHPVGVSQLISRVDRLLPSGRGSWLVLLAAYILWCMTDATDVLVAYGDDRLRLRVTVIGLKKAWPLMAWSVTLVTALVAFAVSLRDTSFPFERIRLAGCFIFALVLLKTVSLSSMVGFMFPWLGMLWSPSGTWGVALFVAVWTGATVVDPDRWSMRRLSVCLFLVFAFLYGAYGTYYVKTTLLHGDESQYMLIAQSLLNDGDIDLSNADAVSKRDFHEIDFETHVAPASPEGRQHSTHPVGLAALLAIPYAIGLGLISHPRLAVVFLQTLLFAGMVPMVVVFLMRQGFSRGISVATAVLVASSPLAVSQSNQIYPEIHAVLVTLGALIAFPGWPFGTGNRPGRWGWTLALIAIVILPFFHQRHLVLSLLLLVPFTVTAFRNGIGTFEGRSLAAVLAVGLLAHVSYNLHYSGDIFGPFLPGNADNIGPDFGRSIPGQWLDAREGLLRVSPIFVLSVFGLLGWLVRRDSRVVLALCLLGATAGVNTLSTDWTFGYCYSSRFMVTGIPALALGVAAGLSRIDLGKRPLGVFLILFAAWIGVETIFQNAILPEIGIEGLNLVSRPSEQFYPFVAHFSNIVSGDHLGWGVLLFWAAVCGALALSYTRFRRFSWMVASLAPLLTASTNAYTMALNGSLVYQTARFSDSISRTFMPEIDLSFSLPTNSHGVKKSSMPPLFRGRVKVSPTIAIESGVKGVRAFHTYAHSTAAYSGTIRHTIPLVNSEIQSRHTFVTDGSFRPSMLTPSVITSGWEKQNGSWLQSTRNPFDRSSSKKM